MHQDRRARGPGLERGFSGPHGLRPTGPRRRVIHRATSAQRNGVRGIGMAWVILFIAGLFEMAWALLLKESHGLTRLLPTVGFVGFRILRLLFLRPGLQSLPLGPACAGWAGLA